MRIVHDVVIDGDVVTHGSVVEVPDDLGRALIHAGRATIAEAPPVETTSIEPPEAAVDQPARKSPRRR